MDKPQKEALYQSVEILSEAKSRAESRVKLVRALVADGELGSEGLRSLQVAYADARARVNAGLDRLLVELETAKVQESAEPYREVASSAAQQIAVFLAACDKEILGDDRGVLEAGLGAAGSISSALVDIWKTLRGEKTERHLALIRRIDSLRWDPFEGIESVAKEKPNDG